MIITKKAAGFVEVKANYATFRAARDGKGFWFAGKVDAFGVCPEMAACNTRREALAHIKFISQIA